MSTSDAEAEARTRLAAHLEAIGQTNVAKNVDELFDLDAGFVGRFDFLAPYVYRRLKGSILISGCAAGSELIVARKYGFKRVVGTEISDALVEIARARLSTTPDMQVDAVHDERLPYADGEFDVVYSGHVIEHTGDPRLYFGELFRVLRRGGLFFLEFPNRYHYVELHTGLPSFEWCPRPLRDVVLRALASRLSPLSKPKKQGFDSVRTTLHPMSRSLIRRYLTVLGGRIIAEQVPAPGFVRLIIAK